MGLLGRKWHRDDEIEDRFWRKVVVPLSRDECWTWKQRLKEHKEVMEKLRRMEEELRVTRHPKLEGYTDPSLSSVSSRHQPYIFTPDALSGVCCITGNY